MVTNWVKLTRQFAGKFALAISHYVSYAYTVPMNVEDDMGGLTGEIPVSGFVGSFDPRANKAFCGMETQS